MNDNQHKIIDSEETIIRLLHQEWFVEGRLQQTAFRLANGETYLSVNRPAVSSYEADVVAFIKTHPQYKTAPRTTTYRRANLNVGDVRNLDLSMEEESLNISVEVEPRSMHKKSHAGIFARLDNKNIKGGQDFIPVVDGKEPVSAEKVLMKMRWSLLQLSQLETCELKSTEE